MDCVMDELVLLVVGEPCVRAGCVKGNPSITVACFFVAVGAEHLDVRLGRCFVGPFTRGVHHLLAAVAPGVRPLLGGIILARVVAAGYAAHEVTAHEGRLRLPVLSANEVLTLAHVRQASPGVAWCDKGCPAGFVASSV